MCTWTSSIIRFMSTMQLFLEDWDAASPTVPELYGFSNPMLIPDKPNGVQTEAPKNPFEIETVPSIKGPKFFAS